ncbi:MAG: bifunctional diaminohydroxyphosphoribosylaminopyrimidine deaminase/5-amino-6-(5-phosphoribosylamino)uracil reductase RibD [Pseudomonadales bacterium]
MFSDSDKQNMARAIELAQRGWYSTTPNPRVGCVLTRDGVVVAEGWHERAGEAHAEAMALQKAGTHAKDCTAYVTLEPCSFVGRTPACSRSLVNAGVSRVVCAMRDPHPKVSGKGIAELIEAGIQVDEDLMRAEARALNPGYIKQQETGLPYVRCKLAMSLDGRTAMASGESQWITGNEARQDVQDLRAQSCAVLTGINTILDDDARLNVRAEQLSDTARTQLGSRQPLRVVMDSTGRCPQTAALLSTPGNVLLVVGKNTADLPISRSENVSVLSCDSIQPEPATVLRALAARDCNDILLEAGPTLAGAFLRQGLVDELIVYMAPKLLGSNARPLLDLPIELMQDSIQLNLNSVRLIGNDLRIDCTPNYH